MCRHQRSNQMPHSWCVTSACASPSEHGVVHAVSGVSYQVAAGETLGIAGGSQARARTLFLSRARPAARQRSQDNRRRSGLRQPQPADALRARLRAVRGAKISMIFQDPMTSLNPVHKIGAQIVEGILCHIRRPSRAQRAAARARALELLQLVGVSAPTERMTQYPHELSGGMRQRVMIAIAIANEPAILIADEPTTALDVTIQAQIMRVLGEIQQRIGIGIILISHDVRLLAQNADRLIIMYAGRIVESGTVTEVLENPKHPYTLGLLLSAPGVIEELAKEGTKGAAEADPGDAAGCDQAARWLQFRRALLDQQRTRALPG